MVLDMEVSTIQNTAFPQDLEGRINSVANIVNTEMKTLTLLHLDDVPVTGRTIRRRIRETLGGNVYLPTRITFKSYCARTLVPIGAVAEEDVLNDSGDRVFVGYKLTQDGHKYGRPIAAFTLDYINKNQISMHTILRSTSSKGTKRAPLNRWKLLHLLKDRSFKLEDLSKELGCDTHLVRSHLENFDEIGFVTYESCGEKLAGTSVVDYELGEGADSSYLESLPVGSWKKKVAEELYKEGNGNAYSISKTIGVKHGHVSSVLQILEQDGFAKHVRWEMARLSEVSITDRGFRFLSDYVEPVQDALQEGASLSRMSAFYAEMMDDSSLFSQLCQTALGLYVSVSGHINQRPRVEVHEEIVSLLRDRPGLRPSEIEKQLSISGLHVYIRPLVRKGVLRKEVEGKKTLYYVVG